MGNIIRIIIIILGMLLVSAIILLLVKRKINERHSLFWLIGAFIILILSLTPDILGILADMVGVDYPPALLFLFAIVVILSIALYQSIQISKLQERLTELTQQTAIQHMKNPMKEEEHARQ